MASYHDPAFVVLARNLVNHPDPRFRDSSAMPEGVYCHRSAPTAMVFQLMSWLTVFFAFLSSHCKYAPGLGNLLVSSEILSQKLLKLGLQMIQAEHYRNGAASGVIKPDLRTKYQNQLGLNIY
ncbi:hypothetical protein FOTG_01356 [Fusarium oxysporum f. sp. vasinfectum 25433]|uniref:Uncharacterized protein n=1 Tax=Fusarium oxysporum f. sp. vasinfectum 25433 TaxID=1089449 RepID=X0NPK4_FUSOX|nr:hypothetical protein FOTG_01356 [Fusarium oxysporum f. sp. vasinfectum 25433]